MYLRKCILFAFCNHTLYSTRLSKHNSYKLHRIMIKTANVLQLITVNKPPPPLAHTHDTVLAPSNNCANKATKLRI